jgi:hypothetical protein
MNFRHSCKGGLAAATFAAKLLPSGMPRMCLKISMVLLLMKCACKTRYFFHHLESTYQGIDAGGMQQVSLSWSKQRCFLPISPYASIE